MLPEHSVFSYDYAGVTSPTLQSTKIFHLPANIIWHLLIAVGKKKIKNHQRLILRNKALYSVSFLRTKH